MRRWPYTFVVCLSIATALAAAISASYLGVPLKDPDGFLGPAYVRLPLLALIFFGGGVLLASLHRIRWWRLRQLPKAIVDVVKYEWTGRRALYVAVGMASFYACYVGYRNLKNDLPIYRHGVLYDKALMALDHWLTFGHNPDVLLHHLLGTHVTAEVLSFAYLAYLPLVPISLGAFLLLERNLRIGAWYATALCLNWVLGVISYYILPALGPFFAEPESFWGVHLTEVTRLQHALLRSRVDVLTDPTTSAKISGVAAFASLHVSVAFMAAVFLERTRQHYLLRILTWILFGLIVIATLYFGWHYIADDVAGLLIGWGSVVIGAWATGSRRRRRRSMSPGRAQPVIALNGFHPDQAGRTVREFDHAGVYQSRPSNGSGHPDSGRTQDAGAGDGRGGMSRQHQRMGNG
jgi:membrane-associated phospholipid phosphatase